MQDQDNLIQQKIDSLLKKGIVLSILWLAGIGSLIALVFGLRASGLLPNQTALRVVWVVFGQGSLNSARLSRIALGSIRTNDP